MLTTKAQIDRRLDELDRITGELKTVLLTGIFGGVPKQSVEAEVSRIIKNSGFSDAKIRQSLAAMTQRLYMSLRQNLTAIAEDSRRKLDRSVASLALDASGKANVSQEHFRGLNTELRITNGIIKNYQQLVREQIRALGVENPVIRLGKRTLTARAYAEMRVRREANLRDLATLKKEGHQFAWISSHANCSKRCAPYQGRLVALNGTASGYHDGIRYLPLSEVLAGEQKDGNGCISGYNCRHYLIPYEPGSKAPLRFNPAEMEKEREIDARQRYYENGIRKISELKKAEPDPKVRRRLTRRLKKWRDSYFRFSTENHRAILESRLRDPGPEPGRQVDLGRLSDNLLAATIRDRPELRNIAESEIDAIVARLIQKLKAAVDTSRARR